MRVNYCSYAEKMPIICQWYCIFRLIYFFIGSVKCSGVLSSCIFMTSNLTVNDSREFHPHDDEYNYKSGSLSTWNHTGTCGLYQEEWRGRAEDDWAVEIQLRGRRAGRGCDALQMRLLCQRWEEPKGDLSEMEINSARKRRRVLTRSPKSEAWKTQWISK